MSRVWAPALLQAFGFDPFEFQTFMLRDMPIVTVVANFEVVSIVCHYYIANSNPNDQGHSNSHRNSNSHSHRNCHDESNSSSDNHCSFHFVVITTAHINITHAFLEASGCRV